MLYFEKYAFVKLKHLYFLNSCLHYLHQGNKMNKMDLIRVENKELKLND